jgi:hypothetical protein
MVMIVDPTFLSKEMIDESGKIDPYKLLTVCASVAHGSKLHAGQINLPNKNVKATVSEHGGVDGRFPVFAKYGRNGRVAELKISFTKRGR